MPRPPGSRNRDYAATRHALAVRLAPRLLRPDGEPAGLTDLAAAADVSTTTLKHYFADRDGIYSAAMQAVLADSQVHLHAMRDPGGRPPAESVPALLLGTVAAWRWYGLGRVFAAGLALGLEHTGRGPAFLAGVLEPFLQAVEDLLAAHVRQGELPDLDRRATALSLVAPVLVALLHQDSLGGAGQRHLDVEAYARQHAGTILAGLGRDPGR